MPSAEKYYIGLLEILLHIGSVLLCLGVLTASAVAVSTIGDIFPHDIPDTKIAERRDRYEAIAWCLLAVSFASIIFHFIMAIIRGLYLGNIIIENSFLTFTIISALFSVLFGFMMVAGGGASVANAVDVQNEFLDRYYYYGEVKIDCSDIDDFPSDNPDFEVLQDICHNLEKLKNCQIASAAISFLGGEAFAVLTALTLISMVRKKRESSSYEMINN